MAKKKTLNKADKFYIKEHISDAPEQLQEDLNLEDVAIVLDEIERMKKGVTAEELFGRNEQYGVVVMTQEASQLADERRSERINKTRDVHNPDRRTDNKRDEKYRTDAIRPIK